MAGAEDVAAAVQAVAEAAVQKLLEAFVASAGCMEQTQKAHRCQLPENTA